MKKARTSSVVRLAVAAFALCAGAEAQAAAQRSFVASFGSDANAALGCSIANPCRGFAAAIGQTNAGGEVVVLDSAGYGPATITKSIALIAPPGVHAAISVFAGDGIVVNAPGGTVVLRGLAISGVAAGADTGIRISAALETAIDRVVISGFSSGVNVVAGDTAVRISASAFSNFGDCFALTVPPATRVDATVDDTTFHECGSGISAAPQGTLNLAIDRSTFAANLSFCVFVAVQSGGAADLVVSRTSMAQFGQGVTVGASAGGAAASAHVVLRETSMTSSTPSARAAFFDGSGTLDVLLDRVGISTSNTGNAGFAVLSSLAGTAKAHIVDTTIEGGGIGIAVQTQDTGSVTLDVSDSSILHPTSNGVQLQILGGPVDASIVNTRILPGNLGILYNSFTASTAQRLVVQSSSIRGGSNDGIGLGLTQAGARLVFELADSMITGSASDAVSATIIGGVTAAITGSIRGSTLSGNASSGVLASDTSGAGTITLGLVGNTISDNGGSGVNIANLATVSATLTGNTVVGNGTGLRTAGASKLFTAGDNIVRGNTTDLVGALQPVTPKM